MGDLVAGAVVKELVGRLTSQVFKEFDLIWGFKKDISSLKDDFEQIEAVLVDAQEKRIKEKEVDLWLTSLRSACLKIENVLDEISTEALLQRLYKNRGIKYVVRSFMSSSHNRLMFHVRIAHKVKDIRRELDAIKSRRSKLGLKSNPGDLSQVDVNVASDQMPNRETSSLTHDSLLIFGRNEEVEMVTETICNKDVGKHEINSEIRVYGIWGMGGVGKTTLGQLVYNHERVNQYFELKCWVYVSENFQPKEIIKEIITSIDKCECTLTSLEMLQVSIQNKLRGKKFLIVLDDVWIEDGQKERWEELSKALSCGAEGSIVVMTTRSHTTSKMFAKVPELQHNLGCLSQEDSWSLFEKFAFAQGRDGDNISELEPIGRKIVENCEGLPLAIKTLGSLMWSKRSTLDWENVKGNIIWNLQEYNVLPALKLSYDNLLPYMKKCFAYCCLFPKGHEMEKNTVIQLWVANDFIPPRGQIDLYVLGEDIFNCLVWRSFFQIVKANEYSDIDRYKMHDLMHDMARNVMGGDCLVIDHARTEVEIPNEVLHLSSSRRDFLCPPHDIGNLTSLRSILMWAKHINESCISEILDHMYLRVLYLPRLRTLPKSVCKLKHLRYLNLSHSNIKVLPESIIYLQNLQVLLLCYSDILRKLPDGLRFMTNLQYLDIERCYSITYLPLGIKDLTSLRIKLSEFPVGKESGAKIGELEDLNVLEEELKISRLENVGGLSDAKSANLKCKRNLSVLELRWSAMSPYAEEVLEGLEPNPGLKKLKIFGYPGKIISSSWMVNLSNLVKIRIEYCNECERISSLGRLPNLRVITLKDMSSLKSFHNDDTINMFPSLEKLYFYYCENLIGLPCNLPKLKKLHIRSCHELVSLHENMTPSLEELSILWCGKLVSLPPNLPKLNYLGIHDSGEFVSLQENMFPSLEGLRINSCRNFVTMPCNLPKLKFLLIKGCDKLVTLQVNMFPSLEELHILGCGNLVSLPWNLPKLKILKIQGGDKLVSVPDELQRKLDVLEISDCKHLNSTRDIKTDVNNAEEDS